MTSRRRFLSASAAALAAGSGFVQTLHNALASVPARAGAGLSEIDHVVVLMQENRSFDHYFGTLAGVRGFSDPRAAIQPSGQPVWYQPEGAGYVLPYHFDMRQTNAARIGLDHNWKGSEAVWKHWNAWVAKKTPYCMGYFDRADLPFYYALADAFTICDAYHCSVFGPTDPNRLYALSGHANGCLHGLADPKLYNVYQGAGKLQGKYHADIAQDRPDAAGLDWQSYAEVLEENGVSWKVYQEWDNYGDNYLQYFKNFRVDAQGRPLTPDAPLYRRGRAMAPGSTRENAAGTSGQWLVDDFAADVKAGRLPAVSWICAPAEYCEHPDATPNAGEHFTARVLDALAAVPEVWARTVLILTYDENDGFFDHVPPAMPPLSPAQGYSTAGNEGEVYQGREPVGLGPRVPTLVISPWSRGGRVNSQLFDHTSLIRFMEEWLVQGKGMARERVQCRYISPWRRALCGDLTSTLSFAAPDAGWPAAVPRAASYFRGWGTAAARPPVEQALPHQEAAALPRAACALPYRLQVAGRCLPGEDGYALELHNMGAQAVACIVSSREQDDGPWHYTVGAGQRVSASRWPGREGRYQLTLSSHNGYLREFRGSLAADGARVEVNLLESPERASVRLLCRNEGARPCRLQLRDLAYGGAAQPELALAPGEQHSVTLSVAASLGWYDIGVTLAGDGHYWRRLSGHLEGAGLDYADPVLSGLASVASAPVN